MARERVKWNGLPGHLGYVHPAFLRVNGLRPAAAFGRGSAQHGGDFVRAMAFGQG